jgi:hypothetical protein
LRATSRISEKSDRFAKTIVFCLDQEHAEEMRRALNKWNADLARSTRTMLHVSFPTKATSVDPILAASWSWKRKHQRFQERAGRLESAKAIAPGSAPGLLLFFDESTHS